MSTSVSKHMFGRIETICLLTEIHLTKEGAAMVHRAIDAMELGECPFCKPCGLE